MENTNKELRNKAGMVKMITIISLILNILLIGFIVFTNPQNQKISSKQPITPTALPAQTDSILPFAPSEPFVKAALTHYIIAANVKSITLQANNKYLVTLNIPNGRPVAFPFPTNYQVVKIENGNPLKPAITIQNVKPNDMIQFNIIYNAKLNFWDVALSNATNNISN